MFWIDLLTWSVEVFSFTQISLASNELLVILTSSNLEQQQLLCVDYNVSPTLQDIGPVEGKFPFCLFPVVLKLKKNDLRSNVGFSIIPSTLNDYEQETRSCGNDWKDRRWQHIIRGRWLQSRIWTRHMRQWVWRLWMKKRMTVSSISECMVTPPLSALAHLLMISQSQGKREGSTKEEAYTEW